MEKFLLKWKDMDSQDWIIGDLIQFVEFSKTSTNMPDVRLGIEYSKHKKIFEGDIVKHMPEDKIGIVKFGKYRSPTDDLETGHYGFYVEWINDIGILRKDIGFWINHENTEILEK